MVFFFTGNRRIDHAARSKALERARRLSAMPSHDHLAFDKLKLS